MKRTICLAALGVSLALACLVTAQERKSADEATQKRIDGKTSKLLEAIHIDDSAKSERVKLILADWYTALWGWHAMHDEELGKLWADWGRARSVVPKDEFPGEVIAHQIDEVYSSLKPTFHAFQARLAAELDAEQLDAIKERWSRSPGMTRTYQAYLEIAPDLSDEQRKVILGRMMMAREDAMLTDADREIVNIYKRHKVKVEQYIGSIEWTKLHKAFAEKGQTAATGPSTRPSN